MDKLMSAAGASNVNKKTDTIELLPHNQMLYDKIVAEMENGEYSIFYSEATGLGKSFIFMRLVQDYFVGKKIMYVVPKISIWKNLTRYKEFESLNADIDMTTYASFNRYDSSLCNKYDVVFVDECHHMLSEIQGNNVNKFCKDMNALNKYSFGFTATPYYKGTYVDEECFNVSCYGYDVCEAINLGILPKIHFSVANIDIDDIPMDMRVRYSITGTKTLLEQLLERNADKNKWIAYFLNKVELEQNMHELKTLFPDYTILKVYDGIYDEDNVYDTFNNSTGKVILLSVNKLLEGVHLKGVQGVLLYRNVTEFSTYMQMYGRLCDISANESPIFLDVANAIFSINKFSEDIFKSNRCGNKVNRRIRDFFDVYAEDYWTVELMDIIINSPNPYFVQWTQEEDEIIINKYPSMGTDVKQYIPNKTKGQIFRRARQLSVDYVGYATNEFIDEIKGLLEEGLSIAQIADKYKISKHIAYEIIHKHLPGFICDRTYSEHEDTIIIENYNKGLSYKEIADIVNDYYIRIGSSKRRTETGISMRCRSLDIVPKSNSKPFSSEELDILREYGETLTIPEIMVMLPGRDYNAIHAKLRTMGMTTKPVNEFQLTEEFKMKCVELNKRYLKGAKLGVLEKEIGVSKGMLARVWDSMGLPAHLNYTQIFSRPDNYNILCENWSNPNREQIFAKEFPEVSYASILRIHADLGLESGKIDRVMDEELELYKHAILYHITNAELCEQINKLSCNLNRNIKRTVLHVKHKRSQIYKQMLSEGYDEYLLSDCYTPEEDSIVIEYKRGEYSLDSAVSAINNLELNKRRYIIRTKSSVESRAKDMKRKQK